MTMHVIGAGVGRTGTYSLKLALNHLGLGPCHHMEEVLHNQPTQVPPWAAAVKGSLIGKRFTKATKAPSIGQLPGFFVN